jgi:NAD-reducing hydrogenase small subunit
MTTLPAIKPETGKPKSASGKTQSRSNSKVRLATVWLAGCSGCHMSFLDLDELLIDLAEAAELVYSPIADVKEFPENVDVTLVEGAVANVDNLELAQQIRSRSKVVVSFGDCAVTGNVPTMRNWLQVDDLLTQVYHEGPGKVPRGADLDRIVPALLPKVLPLHQVISVDAFIPGCPPDPKRIWAAVSALLRGEPVMLDEPMRKFG